MPSPADPLLSPEFRLLADALRPAGAEAQKLLRAGWADIDFDQLHNLARRHRVAPGLAQTMTRAGLSSPPAYVDMPGATLSQAAFHELALAATTRQVVDALEDSGITPVVLKGVPLSYRLHGRLGLRTSRDIDLLVTPGEASRALDILADMGFLPTMKVDRNRLPSLMRRRKDVELVSADGRHIVELHWRLFDNPHLLPVTLRPPVKRVSLPGDLFCMVLEDRFNLLYLANHGAQHGWSRLKWLADFAGLAHSLGPEACAALHAGTPYAAGRRALGQAWLLGSEWLGLERPAQVDIDMRRDFRMRLLTGMGRRIMAGSGATEIEAMRFGSTRKNLSHYLIRSTPSYLLAEASFDLSQFPETESSSRWHRFGAAGRIMSWSARRLFSRSA